LSTEKTDSNKKNKKNTSVLKEKNLISRITPLLDSNVQFSTKKITRHPNKWEA
jgi:hypothetical protein